MFHWKSVEFICALCLIVVGTVGGTGPAYPTATEVFCVALSQNNNYTDHDDWCKSYGSNESHTLAFYMNNKSNYFKSHQTYIFQQGEHIPLGDSKVKIKNATNLTLTGPNEDSSAGRAIINCNKSVTAFHFLSSSYITIANLTFSGCIAKKHHGKGAAPLVFINGSYLSLLRLRVYMSVHQAFVIKDVQREVVLDSLEIANSSTNGKPVPVAGNGISYQRCRDTDQRSKVYILHSRFFNNSNYVKHLGTLFAAGLTIELLCPNVEVKIINVNMSHNIGSTGGNLALLFNSTKHYFNASVEIINSHFDYGNAKVEGGGMYVSFIESSTSEPKVCTDKVKPHSLLYVYNSTFNNNIAKYAGSGVYLRQKQSLTLHNPQTITFIKSTFKDNSMIKAGFGGIAVHSINFMVTDYLHHLYPQFHIILVNCSIHGNSVGFYPGDGSGTGAVFTKSNNNFQMNNTAVYNNRATGLLGMSSNIILSNNITIINNTGSSGGGVLLCQNAVMYFEAHTNVTISRNHANHTGGGICVQTDYLQSKPICFFQFAEDPLSYPQLARTVNVSVYDNHAIIAGNNIFGGSIEYCYMIDSPKHKANRSREVYDAIFHVPRNKESPSSITSSPRHLCFCQNNAPNCSVHHYKPHPIFPGETINVDAVLVGQYNGTVPGTVGAKFKSLSLHSVLNKEVQDIKTVNCTKLYYTIYSSRASETIMLEVQHTGDISGFDQFWKTKTYFIDIEIKKCPMGFFQSSLNSSGTSCNCSPFLKNLTKQIKCSIKYQTIKRMPPAWIGYVTTKNGSKALAYHSNCPLDYCVTDEITYINATKHSLLQDKQCAYNRTGLLCGSCQRHLSIVIGSSECRKCSNYWQFLYIVYAVVGVAALVLLTLFNITIAEGTLSGVIFYCNVVKSNINVFFTKQNVPFLSPLLNYFLSLINMESLVPHCLFNGMDTYTKTWLNFAFPIYIWFITGVLICLGNRCSWLVRRNAVKVLATLILLSYARLLSSVTDALQVRFIHVEGGGYKRKWLLDAEVEYFNGKHIHLVIFALLFALLLLPFTFCLVFIQCLQSVSHYKGFSWINKLKPFFDVYTGPFTSKGRSWTGLLLLSRAIVCIVSAVNATGDPKKILGTVSLIVISLFFIVSLLPNGLYRNRRLTMLECLWLLNLGTLSSLLYISPRGELFAVFVSHACVSIALMTTIGIVIYHITSLAPIKKAIRKSKCYRKLLQLSMKRNTTDPFSEIDTIDFPPYEPFNEEREPLLASNNEE